MESSTKPDFLTVAVNRKMISAGESKSLSSEATERGIQPSQLAIEKGLLSSAQVDIVQALTHPRDTAPGYEILDVLGYGGLGVVYRARQLNLDRVVALKTMLLKSMDRPGVLARFELEAKSVGKLRHPNIVTAYDYGTHDGRLYLSMELVEGEDLDERLKRIGRLDESTAWSIARQTAAGLAHAAEHDIVHRDIKPANLMLTPAPQGFSLPAGVPMVKITDFGLAFLTAQGDSKARLTVTGTTMGTPQYMAPEQLSEPTVDLRADIYALGATVYHLLSGVPPFQGETTGQVLANKIKGAVTDLAELAEGVSYATIELVRMMMATAPEDRPQSYPELIDRIDGLANIPHDLAPAGRQTAATTATLTDIPETKTKGQSARRLVNFLGQLVRVALFLAVLAGFGALAYALRDDDHFRELVEKIVPAEFFNQGDSEGLEGPRMKAGLWRAALFNGENLNGWAKPRGQWKSESLATGDVVLAGKAGAVSRRLPVPKGPGSRPPTNYEVRLYVDLHSAKSVEIHFAPVSLGAKGDQRYVLRLDRAGAVLGRHAWASRTFLPVTETVPLTERTSDAADDDFHELRVGRHGNQWLAYFNKTLVGSVPVLAKNEAYSIGLVVEGRTAYFKNLSIVELVSPDESTDS